MTSRLVRILAIKRVSRATCDGRGQHPTRASLVVHQLDSTENDVRALIWSVGFAWSVRTEHIIGSIRPVTNCLLLLPALYLAAHILIGRLVWYGLPPPSPGLSDDARGLLRLALAAGLMALVGCVAPGHVRRRVFVASAFPILGLTSQFGGAWGMAHLTALGQAGHIAWSLLGAIGFGLVMTTLLALPALILYRNVAVPVIVLAAVPTIARANWTATAYLRHPEPLAQICWHACPFICAAIGIVAAIATCRHWQQQMMMLLSAPDT